VIFVRSKIITILLNQSEWVRAIWYYYCDTSVPCYIIYSGLKGKNSKVYKGIVNRSVFFLAFLVVDASKVGGACYGLGCRTVFCDSVSIIFRCFEDSTFANDCQKKKKNPIRYPLVYRCYLYIFYVSYYSYYDFAY
jgi:hypothetical protein